MGNVIDEQGKIMVLNDRNGSGEGREHHSLGAFRPGLANSTPHPPSLLPAKPFCSNLGENASPKRHLKDTQVFPGGKEGAQHREVSTSQGLWGKELP